LAKAPPIAHIGIIAAAVHAIWQMKNFDDTNSTLCLRLFRANRNFGLFIVVGMIAGCFLK
ncbi:MAG TPA: 4-hydroxybenzoate octaprenyltransferase, partial [Aestuariivirga sp.]